MRVYFDLAHYPESPGPVRPRLSYTETDDNDLTYFILHQIDVIRRAVEELHKYIEMKAARLKAMERELHSMVLFNHRQRALISHALRHPNIGTR